MTRVSLASLAVGCVLLRAAAAGASPYPLENILDAEVAAKLAKEKLTTSDELLERAAKAGELKKLAKTTGLAIAKLTEWAELCDVVRLKGVGPEMTRLLRATGVKTIKQLRAKKAKPLHKAMTAANQKSKMTEKPPSEDQVQSWIDQAKTLKLVLK